MKKSNIIIGILIIGFIFVSGCDLNQTIPGEVQTLKQYYDRDLDSINGMPLEFAARAKILDIRLCKDSNLPDDVSNDCGILGGDMITLQDINDFSFTRKYSFSTGQIVPYLMDVLQEGDTCQFNFKTKTRIIESVNYCGKATLEQIEEAKNSYSEVFLTIISEDDYTEYGGSIIKLEKVNDDGGIVISVDNGNYLNIDKDSEIITKDCFRIVNEFTEVRPNSEKVASLSIEKANLCGDSIGNIADGSFGTNCPEGVVC